MYAFDGLSFRYKGKTGIILLHDLSKKKMLMAIYFSGFNRAL